METFKNFDKSVDKTSWRNGVRAEYIGNIWIQYA